MERKSLKDISWDVPENVYREDPALSYSILAKFEREGFERLNTLFDKVDSPSLLFGSAVDTLITDGEKAFEERFFVSDISSVKPSVVPIVKRIYEAFHNSYTDIKDIPDSSILPIIVECDYQRNWKEKTRCESIKNEGSKYYQSLFMAGSKAVIPQSVYNKVFACVRALKDSVQTYMYFKDNDPYENIERYYQLKFKGKLNGIDFRCMADLILVNYKSKVIIPCDLKTSSHREYDFPKSFIQWRYDVQARLYYRLIKQAMEQDEYFKDFTLLPYKFIVVNNIDNPVPLVWEFLQTKEIGEIMLAGQICRDPEQIARELLYYLEERPPVPCGIYLDKANNIEEWLTRNTQ